MMLKIGKVFFIILELNTSKKLESVPDNNPIRSFRKFEFLVNSLAQVVTYSENLFSPQNLLKT